MPRNTYTYGGLTFKTQKEAKDHFKWIKTGGVRAIMKDDQEFPFLRDLYYLHPDAPNSEPLVFDFCYHPNHGGVQLGVIVGLSDGDTWPYPSTKWGFAIPDQKRDNPWPIWERIQIQTLKAKMRQMVKYQVDDYRCNHSDGLCEICSIQGEDVDHIDPTFIEIFDLWMIDRDPFALKITDDTIDNANPEFEDVELFADWLEHHAKLAKYQLLCKPCHHAKTHSPKEAA